MTMPSVASLTGVTHQYGDIQALDDVTVALPAGQMVGLIGPDGVGKSSLLALVAGVRRIQTGEVSVLGGDMRQSRFRSRTCPRIAYMPQGLGKNLYMTLSVFENLDFFARLFAQGPGERATRIAELLDGTGLTPFRDRPAGQLSGGMKQKLGLCCALIHDPDLLILDEPTTGVDPLSRRQFWRLIDRLRQRRPGMSVLVATAYMSEAQQFDWLAAMDAGRILATGRPGELLSQTGTDNLDDAFIQLLPERKRADHQTLVVPPRPEHNDGIPAIRAEGLTRRFGDFVAVDNVSFEIRPGEIFGFVGSNGCGKTTTMKMLTGLLPANNGQAVLFGQPVDGSDLAIRKRVGFMSQGFSLYTELSVRQNLELHARLFHLPTAGIPQRVAEMIDQFNLARYESTLAGELALGIRQRLSLAVALIHHPDMLILDEPTSGVDPIARDDFWQQLIRLSREDGVTIFVSTHFMNEAERCDRIALMHAGRVLAVDSPEGLAAAHGSGSLEEAFIHYLERADGAVADHPDTHPLAMANGRGANAARPASPLFSLRRLLGYARRETLEVRRDPVRLTFALAGSVLLLFVLGFGISTDVENITFAAFDQDHTPESREYIQNIAGSRYFTRKPAIAYPDDLEARMRSGELSLAIEIPPGFGRSLRGGRSPEVAAWVDGAMPTRAETIGGYVMGMHRDFLARHALRTGGQMASAPLADVQIRFRYNQDFKSLYAMVPATLAILLVMIPSVLVALGVVREKELGSITNLYATPVTRLEFLLGKQLPYIAVSMVNFVTLVLVSVWIMDVPLKGSFVTLALGALLYVSATTGLGLLMSAFARTQIAALFGTMIATLLPAESFSGMNDPVASLEGPGAIIGQFYPTTYFLNICRGTFTKALGFQDLQSELLILALFAPVLILISLMLLKKQER